MRKIEEVRQQVLAGDSALASEISLDAVNAIFTGMRGSNGDVTPEWKKLMSHYANNTTELDRLCGKDKTFNNSKWGPFCLAYIAGDATCGEETATTTGTGRSITLHDQINENHEMVDCVDAEYSEFGGGEFAG